MPRNYERLPIEEFGKVLITSGDLDPVYIALNKMFDPDSDQLHRWLVAYWCFYHAGFASYASESIDLDFWKILLEAATNNTSAPPGGRWPRGHERRHFRGVQGEQAIYELMERYYHAETMVRYISKKSEFLDCYSASFSEISKMVQTHRGFGPWISFKVGDMLERLDILRVDFTGADVFMFQDPAKAAEKVYREKISLHPDAVVKRDVIIPQVVKHLEGVFSEYAAPPLYDRPVGLQEIETILCKWKSHMNGHYPLNNDIDEIRAGLSGWGDTADKFGKSMP